MAEAGAVEAAAAEAATGKLTGIGAGSPRRSRFNKTSQLHIGGESRLFNGKIDSSQDPLDFN